MFVKLSKIQLRNDTQTAGGKQTSAITGRFSNFLLHLITYILNKANTTSPFTLPCDFDFFFP